MAEESKPVDLKVNQDAAAEVVAGHDNSGSDDEHNDAPSTSAEASTPAKKKKSSKKKKMKAAMGPGPKEAPTEAEIQKKVNNLSKDQLTDLLSMNPALAAEVGFKEGEDQDNKAALEAMKKLSLQDIMTGLAAGGKNAKDMASYKFWATQPVPKFGENSKVEEGPFKMIDSEKVSKEPSPMLPGFEWVTMDLTKEEQLQEVFELLYGHYVEDQEAMFRFNYSTSFLRWALLSPGWQADWHVGVRAIASQKLVAFISGVPVSLRVRQKILKATEINFLCIHKKLRSKRLAPVLIKEVTRRCYLKGIYQALYTAGVVLPTPVSTCRYFHRSLDWAKLYDVGFSNLPRNSKPSYQVSKYKLPENTSTKGLRAMEEKDIDAVLDLLKRYLAKFDMAPVFTKEEVKHWLLHRKDTEGKNEQVVWSYVVEDPRTKNITDYFSFYNLESTVIGNPKHETIRAAYLFYYACETALDGSDRSVLKVRLNALIHDALILAKKAKFDVFNALTLLDNTLFLDEQKFGKGDGQLHYYLYNYNANAIAGGVDKYNEIDEKGGSGVGVVML